MIAFLMTIFCLTLLALVRNEWTYRKRVWMIYNDYDNYFKLPSYYSMVLTFWVWDIRKFIKK